QPLVERRLLDADPFEEIALVQLGGALARFRRPLSGQRLESHDVDVEAQRLECHVTVVGEEDRVASESAAKRYQSLAEALPRVLVARVGPQERRELVAGMPATRPYREIGEEGLGLVGQRERFARAQPRLKASEKDE